MVGINTIRTVINTAKNPRADRGHADIMLPVYGSPDMYLCGAFGLCRLADTVFCPGTEDIY